MKRSLTLPLIIILFTFNHTSGQTDSTRNKLKASAIFTLNSNGISSIPAFSLDKPALIASVFLIKGRFSYEPVLAYGMDLKAWYIDNWFNYRIINRPKFALIAGFNASTFFTKYKLPEESLQKAERYFAFALTGLYKITPSTILNIAYWSDNGQDGGVKGHFFNLSGEKTNISLSGRNQLAAMLQVFYINYEGNNDGLFVTPRLAYSITGFPLSAFLMATQAIQSNIDPFPEFRWNIGLAYSL